MRAILTDDVLRITPAAGSANAAIEALS